MTMHLNEVTKAENELADARARSTIASAAIAPGGNQPAIAAALAAVEKARLDLAHTVIRAPTSGIVAKSDRLLVGQSAITGVAMLSIVGDQQAWVEANFKEGDLAKMAVGQPAEIEFDAYPDLKMKGHVASIGSGTGQRIFSPSRAERQRQLGQGDAARAGADRLRRKAAARNDRGPELDRRSARRRQAMRQRQ